MLHFWREEKRLTSGLACFSIDEDSEFDDLAVRAEEIDEVVFLGAPGEVSDEDGRAVRSAAAASSATAVAASATTAAAAEKTV